MCARHAGVILESEEFHRLAYNASFQHFDVKVDGKVSDWSVQYYDELQNSIGGGKQKMRHYFSELPERLARQYSPQCSQHAFSAVPEMYSFGHAEQAMRHFGQ